MGVTTAQQMADRVAGLLDERLKIGGKGLEAKLKRGGRRLPRKVRQEAEYLAAASQLAQHPKMQMQLNDARIAEAYDICVRHLNKIGATDRLVGRLLGITGSIALAVLVVGGGLIAILRWRGFL